MHNATEKRKIGQKSSKGLKEIDNWIVKLNPNHIWEQDTQNMCLFVQYLVVKTTTELEISVLSFASKFL